MTWQEAGGRRRTRTVEAASREEAQASLLRLRLERIEGERERAEVLTRTTLGEWCDTWVATELPRLAISPRTAESYRENLAVIARSPHASTPLAGIGIAQVEALLTWRLGEAPSRNSVRLLRAALSRCLADAERIEIIVRNPARLARLPA